MSTAALDGYRAAAAELIDRYESVSSRTLFAPVWDALPQVPCRVLDVGAGTGRDAAWFAKQGHAVTAVEPISAFRAAAQEKHKAVNIEWVNDTLPALRITRSRSQRFDLIMLSAVWHHVDPKDLHQASAALHDLAAEGACLIVSLRHGPSDPDRAAFPVDPLETISHARDAGFTLKQRVKAASVQVQNATNGVTWTWLAFQKT